MANYISNVKCYTCNVELHLTGTMNYVSLETSRFWNLHHGHNVRPMLSNKETDGLDNGTERWEKTN